MKMIFETPLGTVTSRENPDLTVQEATETLEDSWSKLTHLVVECEYGVKVVLLRDILQNSIIRLEPTVDKF